jgi:hypothetical protein
VSVVDHEGRLFGRINLFDMVAGVAVLASLALGAVGYRLLRVPAAPTIDTLTPSTLTAGPDLRIIVTGDNLLPFMRAFLQRTAKPAAVMHDLSPWSHFDNYALANGTLVRWLIESQHLAEVRLPDGLLPGTYDLIIYDQANIVAIREAAFTITPAPVKQVAVDDPLAIVRVRGAFSGMSREAAASLTGGLKLSQGSGEPWGEILSVNSPAPDEARIDVGERSIIASMANQWQVRAELRARCTVSGFKCYLPNMVLLAPGSNITIDVNGKRVLFVVGELLSDAPERSRDATVTIRFLARPATLALVHANDQDVSPGDTRLGTATIVSAGSRGEMSTEITESLTDGSIRTTDRVASLECTVRIPVLKMPTGFWYRGQPIRAGAGLTFQTDAYVVRGTITSAPNPR